MPMATRVSRVEVPRWGTMVALSSSRRPGWTSGSCSNTSSPAAPSSPAARAAARAASSTIGPLAVLTRTAVGFMRASSLGPDQVAGRRRQAGVDGDEVGLGQQLVQLPPGHAEGGLLVGRQPVTGGVEHRHPEPGGPPGHRPPDPAEPDHPEGLAVDLEPEEELRPPDPGPPGPQEPVPVGDPPGRGQQQRPGQVGGGLGDHVGGVGGQHAPGRAGVQVEVVEPDGVVGHHPPAPGRPGPAARRRPGRSAWPAARPCPRPGPAARPGA